MNTPLSKRHQIFLAGVTTWGKERGKNGWGADLPLSDLITRESCRWCDGGSSLLLVKCLRGTSRKGSFLGI